MSEVRARILVFSASASVLVLEILAGRLMAPYAGVSIETFTAIIGVILAGIATGSAVGGRLADRFEPRSLIGPALLSGGALAWLSLWVVAWLGPELGSDPAAVVMLALLAFFAPAAVLSTVTPIATKLRLRSLDETGTVVGDLSAAGTAGALFGTFVTGFVLVAALATRPVVIGLGALLVAAGVWFILGSAVNRPPLAKSALGVLMLLAGALGAGLLADNPCEFESAYSCGRVLVDESDPSVRLLILDTLRHAAVDLDDPTHLEFRYIRLFADVINSTTHGPIDAVHLGGGGFTVPRYVQATRPGSFNQILEIDDKLVDVARDQLGFETGPDMQVTIGDGRLTLQDLPSDSFDVVVGDAFSGQSVPWHLTTDEFIAEVDRVLRDDGVYVMNLIDGGSNSFAEWEAATLRNNFEHLEVIVPREGVAAGVRNQVLIASDGPIPALDFDPADGVQVTDVDAFIGNGQVLKDDFAPVERLAANL